MRRPLTPPSTWLNTRFRIAWCCRPIVKPACSRLLMMISTPTSSRASCPAKVVVRIWQPLSSTSAMYPSKPVNYSCIATAHLWVKPRRKPSCPARKCACPLVLMNASRWRCAMNLPSPTRAASSANKLPKRPSSVLKLPAITPPPSRWK